MNFRVVEGSGQLDPSSVLTDENGLAAAMFTAGSRLGVVRVEAAAVDQTAEFHLTVTGASRTSSARPLSTALGSESA